MLTILFVVIVIDIIIIVIVVLVVVAFLFSPRFRHCALRSLLCNDSTERSMFPRHNRKK